MKKIISLIAVMYLALGTVPAFAAEQTDDNEPVFLSLTKTAEPLKDLTTNLTVITQEEIQEKNAKNLGDVIEGELGISYKNNGPLGQTQSVFMRGASSEQTLVLIDGRRVNDIANGGADFTAIPANMIERVEIIRGSGAALYGTGAFGGVINVITKKADEFTPNVNPYFSYGTFNTINAGIAGAYATDKFSVLIAPSMLSSDGYLKTSFYDSKNIFGKIAYRPTENSELVLSGQAYNADIGNPGSSALGYYPSKQSEDNNYLKLDYNTEIGDYKFQVSGYNANYTRKLPAYSNEYNTVNTGFKGNVFYKNLLTLGLEWDKSEFKQYGLDATYTKIIETVNKNRETSAAYLQANLNIGDLTLLPVVRGDFNNDFEDVFTPALSAVYKLTDEIKLSGNASKIWRAPTFNGLYYPHSEYDYQLDDDPTWYKSISEGNPDLKPEEGWSYDIGFEYSKNKFTGMITGFFIDSKNLINWKTTYDDTYTVSTSKPANIDKARQYGYEVGLKYDICENISNKLNYTYTRAEDTKTHKDLVYRPMHRLNYVLSVSPLKSLKLTADVSYNTTIYVHEWNNKKSQYDEYLADYCLLNIRADYKINKYVSLWARCDNLTNDDKYQLSYGYPMPGITGTAGFDIKF